MATGVHLRLEADTSAESSPGMAAVRAATALRRARAPQDGGSCCFVSAVTALVAGVGARAAAMGCFSALRGVYLTVVELCLGIGWAVTALAAAGALYTTCHDGDVGARRGLVLRLRGNGRVSMLEPLPVGDCIGEVSDVVMMSSWLLVVGFLEFIHSAVRMVRVACACTAAQYLAGAARSRIV